MKHTEHLNPSEETGTGCPVTTKYGRTPPNKHGDVGRQQQQSSSLIGDNVGHLCFLGITPRPLTSSWCATWLAVTRQGGFGAVGSAMLSGCCQSDQLT